MYAAAPAAAWEVAGLKSQLCQEVSFVACMLLKFIPLGRPASTLFVGLDNF